MAFALLIGAGLMIRTFVGLRTVDFGVDTSNLLSFQIQLPRGVYMTPNVGQAAGGSIGRRSVTRQACTCGASSATTATTAAGSPSVQTLRMAVIGRPWASPGPNRIAAATA